MPRNDPPSARIDRLGTRIAEACARAGREAGEIVLLAVSKTRSAEEIERVADAGIDRFGENHVDEAAAKQDRLGARRLEWHFIGPIQSNKTRTLAERFDWVQSVDRAKIVRRLGEQRPPDSPPLNVLVQVNIDREPQKAGCAPEEIKALADAVAGHERLCLRGLMAIPSADNTPTEARRAFAKLRELFESLKPAHGAIDTLSMGMSADLEAAIAEGATMVRIGTALFGPRD